ncbi:DUF3857 domain-containing transglutaminase family protein [Lysobacter enzymogenes]|uniref:DUF3857 domain-containing transglutaminase family protein n=1 Tax=Lysobacter enzymogenes TaxID=69 RepID=UPI001AF24707|nr:DUF3857 and transglutaminase domain-containing protein [Lysobacter enzymogenes]QQP99260.1 DUF3857 and transglutaminase domain-containing protein [Lysobacter enzymogenes]
MRIVMPRRSAALSVALAAALAANGAAFAQADSQAKPGAPAAAAPAQAAAAAKPAGRAEEQPARLERMHYTYTVQPNGAYVEQRESALKVLREDAVERAKYDSIDYSASLQTLEVVEAYTLKADGRRIAVPKSNYQVQTNDGRGDGGPAFSDIATTQLVFADVAVGDTVVLNYRLVGKQPMFEGQFSDTGSFSDYAYLGEMKLKYDLPVSMKIRKESYGALKTVRDEVVGDRRILEWSYSNREPKVFEPQAAAPFDLTRTNGASVSTFASYGDIARVYGERALPKAVPTARVRKLADEIAAGKTGQREIAQALYEWVSLNINYAGNCIGLGAVVPRDQDFVLDNRIGDCKDHATLLQALLAAKGIEATQALINSGTTYKLAPVPVASAVNHVLNYLPGLDLYLDATAKGIAFGELPWAVSGKPVLRVDRPELEARTPAPVKLANRQRMDTQLVIAEDGSVKGTMKVELDGRPAMEFRAGLRELTDKDAAELVKKVFERNGVQATGSFRQDDPKPLRSQHRYQVEIDAKQAVQMPGAFPLGPMFMTPQPVAALVGSGQVPELKDEGDGLCGGGRSEETYRIEFPKTVKVLAKPQDLKLESNGSRYEASYRLEGNVLHAHRVIEDATVGPVCTGEYNRGYSEFARKVVPNLKAQVIYQ